MWALRYKRTVLQATLNFNTPSIQLCVLQNNALHAL